MVPTLQLGETEAQRGEVRGYTTGQRQSWGSGLGSPHSCGGSVVPDRRLSFALAGLRETSAEKQSWAMVLGFPATLPSLRAAPRPLVLALQGPALS